MKTKYYIFTIVLLLGLGIQQTFAQKDGQTQLSAEELESYNVQLTDLLSYLEGTVNFLGDPKSPPREKEIIVNTSYLKMFADDKVQVEDDLDDNRDVPIHKNVQAYLKDISFFYRKVKFKFIILEINHFVNEKNQNYFQVSFNRDMEGITIAGDSVSSRKLRYMEVNLDVDRSDLRIASIYTTRLNIREETRNWWNNIPEAWQQVFGSQVHIFDTLMLSDIHFVGDGFILYHPIQTSDSVETKELYDIELPESRNSLVNMGPMDTLFCETNEIFIKLSGILKQKRLDVSGNKELRSLDPLTALSNLEDINCSNTYVTSLFPLRNLNKLRILNFSNTPVEKLSSLFYSTSLEELNCNYTLVKDLSFVTNLYRLKHLEISGLRLIDLNFVKELKTLQLLNASQNFMTTIEPLASLTSLENLDISGTYVQDLSPLKNLKGLKIIDCDNTPVSSVEPLSGLPALEYLKISYTPVTVIDSLSKNEDLIRIYWDSNDENNENLNEKRDAAIRFMKKRPGCLVIFESEELIEGWKVLEAAWKTIATQAAGLSENPDKEELHSLLKVEEVNLENSAITTLKPISNLYNLKRLNAPGVQVDNFDPIGEALDLEYLNLDGTSVKDLNFASKLYHLKELHIENTNIQSLEPLEKITSLKYIYATNSKITTEEAFRFNNLNHACIVVFMGDSLNAWWQGLSEEWKNWFTAGYRLDSPPGVKQLHSLMYTQSIEIKDFPGAISFKPLMIMLGLKELKVNGAVVKDEAFLGTFQQLTRLSLTGLPLTDLSVIKSMPKLESLDLENTSISKLKFLKQFPGLKHLNISGTQVSSLSEVEELQSLESIEFNNTRIKKISQLEDLSALKSVECFNTRVSSKNIEKFKIIKPACKVVYY